MITEETFILLFCAIVAGAILASVMLYPVPGPRRPHYAPPKIVSDMKMSDVVHLDNHIKMCINAPLMLRNIAEEQPENAFVISWPEDGGMPTYHCSTGDMPVVLLRCQEFIHKYYNGDFKED